MENIPKKIYLQIGDADVTIDQEINDFNDLFIGAITWADERINDNDIEYELKQDAGLKNAALPIFDVVRQSEQLKDFAQFLYENEYLVRRSIDEVISEYEKIKKINP